MKAEVVIERGQARLLSPVYLKADAKARWVVEIDDAEVLPPRDWFPEETALPVRQPRKPDASTSPMQAVFNQILGEQALERPGASIGDDHQLLLDAVEQRHWGR